MSIKAGSASSFPVCRDQRMTVNEAEPLIFLDIAAKGTCL